MSPATRGNKPITKMTLHRHFKRELEVGSVMLKQLIASKYIAALRASEQIDQMDTSDLKVRNRGRP